MGIFGLPRFIRRFIRRRTQKIPEERARRLKKNISIVYAVITWNLLGLLIYQAFKGNKTTSSDSSEQKVDHRRWWEGNVYNLDSAKHYTISGFTVTEQKKNTEESEEIYN